MLVHFTAARRKLPGLLVFTVEFASRYPYYPHCLVPLSFCCCGWFPGLYLCFHLAPLLSNSIAERSDSSTCRCIATMHVSCGRASIATAAGGMQAVPRLAAAVRRPQLVVALLCPGCFPRTPPLPTRRHTIRAYCTLSVTHVAVQAPADIPVFTAVKYIDLVLHTQCLPSSICKL